MVQKWAPASTQCGGPPCKALTLKQVKDLLDEIMDAKAKADARQVNQQENRMSSVR